MIRVVATRGSLLVKVIGYSEAEGATTKSIVSKSRLVELFSRVCRWISRAVEFSKTRKIGTFQSVRGNHSGICGGNPLILLDVGPNTFRAPHEGSD